VRAPRPNAKRPWSLRDRLDEHDIAELITAYRDGATAASLAATHGVSLRSVKRLLHIAGVRRRPHLTTVRRQPAGSILEARPAVTASTAAATDKPIPPSTASP
jgi:hypothetical protein